MESSKIYVDTLKDLLCLTNNIDVFDNKILVNLYVTLLSLNNNKYTLLDTIKEGKEIKLLLIKLNNLKVKIQLKRKNDEIEKLANDIKKIYVDKENLLFGYIADKDELFNVIDTLDAKEITNYIDKITKIEISRNYKIDERNELREKILELILKNDYKVDNNIISINDGDEVVSILVDDFFDIFGYLLNINNYEYIYKSDNSNNSHMEIIKEIIEIIRNKKSDADKINKIVIPMVLTYVIPNLNYNVKTNDFVIENIKISDLYNMAKSSNNNMDTAKWQNVRISNEYLYGKLIEMVNHGMYYYYDNKFILELVDNKISDFKVSIDKDKMINFLIDNLNGFVINV